jgi:hypothetical protein
LVHHTFPSLCAVFELDVERVFSQHGLEPLPSLGFQLEWRLPLLDLGELAFEAQHDGDVCKLGGLLQSQRQVLVIVDVLQEDAG